MGSGPYSPAALSALNDTGSDLVILIVYRGHHGNGFEVAARSPQATVALETSPTVLRGVAAEIERSLAVRRAD